MSGPQRLGTCLKIGCSPALLSICSVGFKLNPEPKAYTLEGDIWGCGGPIKEHSRTCMSPGTICLTKSQLFDLPLLVESPPACCEIVYAQHSFNVEV